MGQNPGNEFVERHRTEAWFASLDVSLVSGQSQSIVVQLMLEITPANGIRKSPCLARLSTVVPMDGFAAQPVCQIDRLR